MGEISRLAYAHALAKGADVDFLLRKCGLSQGHIDNPDVCIEVRCQIKFLNLVAEALNDDLLGFRLSQNFDLRRAGFLHYVMASSNTLNDAMQRAARYSSIINEGIKLTHNEGKELTITVDYVGVYRHAEHHQIEFWMAALMKEWRHLTDRHLAPERASFIHRRAPTPELRSFYRCKVIFGADADKMTFPFAIRGVPVLSADTYLNKILTEYCEEALAHRKANKGSLQSNVENAIGVLLPHGKAQIGEVARKLAMGERTLARRLASEGVTFSGVLSALRSDLAKRHLADRNLSISEIAWLLGYSDVAAFAHAHKRWTGSSPRAGRERLHEERAD